MKKILTVVLLIATMAVFIPTTSAITYEETITSVVLLEVSDAEGNAYFGSGFLISNDALILTAAHVIMDETTGLPADYIDICTIESEYDSPNCIYAGEVWAYEENIDLALVAPSYELDENRQIIGEKLSIEDMQEVGLPYVDLADYNPSLGDTLTFMGFPGSSLAPTITLTQGIVSAFTPLNIIVPEAPEGLIWDIQTDATINPGNSGGPAYNEDEKVVGVVDAVSTTGIGGNYGYIIANDVVYLWFYDLVDQGVLNQEFVDSVFTNDYENVDVGTTDLSDIPEGEMGTAPVSTFTDVGTSHTNFNAIDMLYVMGIINGYPDGTFKPDGQINRAELIKMVVEMSVGKPDATKYNNCFPDVKNDWYAPYVCYAKERNWVSGYPDNTFKPANNTNRAEAIKIIVNSYFDGESNIPAVTDVTNMPNDVKSTDWYYKFIQFSVAYDLLDLQHVTYTMGQTGYKYYPANNMTRKEVAEMIYRMLMTAQEVEKYSYVSAMVAATCNTNGFENPESQETTDAILQAFVDNGFPGATEDQVQELSDTYGSDEQVLEDIGNGILTMCPDAANNLQ